MPETLCVRFLSLLLPGCKPLGEKVDQYLVKWRAERESEHKESLAFACDDTLQILIVIIGRHMVLVATQGIGHGVVQDIY